MYNEHGGPHNPNPIPTDLQSMIQLHSYFNSIPSPTESMIKCRDHLEEQISKIIQTINVEIVKVTQQ